MPEVWCWYRNVYGWNRSLWSAVRVDAGKHVDFYRGSVLSTAGRSRVTYFYDRQGVRARCCYTGWCRLAMEKSRSVSTVLVFLGLDPAPPSFRHARPRVRRPSGLDSSVLGPVSNSVVPDL